MKKVLVVEDDKEWQRELKRMVKQAGYNVTVVKSRRGAIQKLKEGQRPDVAVIDMSLTPGDSGDRQGWDVMETAKIPVVVVSGYLRPAEVEKLHREDLAEWFFDKSEFVEEEFLSALDRALSMSKIQASKMWRELERRYNPSD